MADQNTQFYAILTNVGAAKQANADALGVPWKITQMGVGDANGTEPTPNATQTRLINEWRRAPLNQLKVDEKNNAIIVAEQVIPAEVGGKWVREIALYDADGDMVAVANCPPTYKPLLNQGSGRTQVVRMNLLVSSSSNVELKIDPAVVLATREYVDSRITEEINKLDHKQSVRVGTTGNIALSALQSIDGLVLVSGDRVLVKNQNAAKENGLYVASAGAWARTADADSSADVTSGLIVVIEQGATQADSRWQLVTDGVIVIGTTALTFKDVSQGFAPIIAPALVDPTANTPPQFDSSMKVPTTEFVQRALGSFSGGRAELAPAVALPVTDVGRFVVLALGAVQTVSLPLLADVPVGATIALHNPSNFNKTITVNGSDKLSPDGLLYSYVIIKRGDTIFATKESDVWRLHGGGALKYSDQFASVLDVSASSQQLPGLSIKAGYISSDSTAAAIPLTFPVAFPVACVALVLVGWTSNIAAYTHNGRDRSGAEIWRNSNPGYRLDYIAIGY